MAERIKTSPNKNLKNKFRFVVLNDETFEEKFSLSLSRNNVWVFLGVISFTLIFLTASAIIYTPLKYFIPGSYSTANIVEPASPGGVVEGVAVILSVFFSLNLLLGIFNLIPFPPLDGYGVLGLFTTEAGALKLDEFRAKIRTFSIIGLLLGWRLLDMYYEPLLHAGIDAAYKGYR